jgi:hypothetical protein
MKTKDELADFLRSRSAGDVSVPHGVMVEIFDDVALTADTVNKWLRTSGLKFEAGLGHGTVPQWSFDRKK